MRSPSRLLAFLAALVLTIASGHAQASLGDSASLAKSAPRGFAAAALAASRTFALASVEAVKKNCLGRALAPNGREDYLRARYYAPGQGRFTTMDTAPGTQFDPASLNRYAFNHNDPVNRVDPSGQTSLVEVSIATMSCPPPDPLDPSYPVL
jgi:RHS repeat-associated protein